VRLWLTTCAGGAAKQMLFLRRCQRSQCRGLSIGAFFRRGFAHLVKDIIKDWCKNDWADWIGLDQVARRKFLELKFD